MSRPVVARLSVVCDEISHSLGRRAFSWKEKENEKGRVEELKVSTRYILSISTKLYDPQDLFIGQL